MFFCVVTPGCVPVWIACCSAGRPKASHPIGWRTSNPLHPLVAGEDVGGRVPPGGRREAPPRRGTGTCRGRRPSDAPGGGWPRTTSPRPSGAATWARSLLARNGPGLRDRTWSLDSARRARRRGATESDGSPPGYRMPRTPVPSRKRSRSARPSRSTARRQRLSGGRRPRAPCRRPSRR